jgi:thioredoxin reductase
VTAGAGPGAARDLIVIGGGPSGLICALTAVSGVPIEPPRDLAAVVLDRGRIGQFARHGRLRITHRWHLMGDELIGKLDEEARAAGIELREHEAVRRVDLAGEIKVVETDRASYRALAVAVCTGFFPHSGLLEHGRVVRPVFSPAGLEARVIAAGPGETVALLGGGVSTVGFALELHRLRPTLRLLVAVEDDAVDAGALAAAGIEVHRGGVELLRELQAPPHARAELGLVTRGRVVSRRACSLLLVDYNSYTTATAATDFLEGAGLERRQGYVVTDQHGQTTLPGVVAAGNIATPVSGVLTALSTGFVAGLSVHRHLHRVRTGREPDHFPWLPREGVAAHPLARR